jgi:hypothetical protein
MNSRTDILNELKELSSIISQMEKINIFTVPTGYFDSLSDNILASIKDGDNTLTNSFPGQSSFEVPKGYFDTLATTILDKIKAQNAKNASDELRTLSPMLYSIQNENVFKVPQDYFNTLPDTIVDRVRPQQTKVVIMHRRSSAFVKYAVAAAFTGVVALGVFKFTGPAKNNIDPIIAQGIQIAKENKFDEELAMITDADIVKFLEANGTDVVAGVVANSIDENELPSPADYLMDEKTLDNYLDDISVNGLSN